MPCFKFSGSCSLCPWCEYGCPMDSGPIVKEYYLYIEDRKGGYLEVAKSSRKKQDIIDTLNKLIDGTYRGRGLYQGVWGKKYQYTCLIDYNILIRNRHYKIADVQYIPVIELIVTDGERNWNTDIHLFYDINTRKLYYAEPTDYIKYGEPVKFGKEWDGKLVFKEHLVKQD